MEGGLCSTRQLSGPPSTASMFANPSRPGDTWGSLEYMNSCGWLNCPEEACFERVTGLLSQVFQCSVTCCTLIRQDQVWIKSLIGSDGIEASNYDAWGNYVFVPSTREVIVSEDASQDSRFAHNPYVKGPPFLKFFAAAPLVGADGTRYGTLCVADFRRRSFSAEKYALLQNFAYLAVGELEESQVLLDKWCLQALAHQRASRTLYSCIDVAPNGVALLDTRRAAWEMKYVNRKFAERCQEPVEDLIGSGFWHGFTPVDETTFEDITMAAADAGVIRMDIKCNRTGVVFTLVLRPAGTDHMTPGKPSAQGHGPGEKFSHCGASLSIGAPHIVDQKQSNGKHVKYLGLDKCMYLAVIETPEQKSLWKVTSRRRSGSVHAMPFTLTGSARMLGGASIMASGTSMSNASSWSYGDFSPPRDIGHLELGPLIGSGGFGKVYRGVWDNSTVVAVKVVQCTTRQSLQAAMHEGELGMHLSNPHVVKTYRVGTKEEELYEPTREGTVEVVDAVHVLWMVQEYCDWGTLVDAVENGWFRQQRGLFVAPDEQKLYLTLTDIAGGMSHIHASGLVHCDLNGRNVMLQRSSSDPRGFIAKVCDFGLARVAADGKLINRMAGTISHISPEQFQHGTASMAGDVWAFGVLMWEAFTGKRAYDNWESSDIMAAVTSGEVPLLLHDSAPLQFREILAACLQHDPAYRPTFQVVLEMLQRAQYACQE